MAADASGLPSRASWPHRRALLVALALPLAACAPLQRLPAGAGKAYSGRLSLSVRSDPVQNFSAGFDLRGQAEQGELLLTTPLGTTLARARWMPGRAELNASGTPQIFPSMEELLMQVTGAALPLAALFDWLEGRATPVPGWEADLSGRPQGRLWARRSQALPVVELRLLLDEPR